jgi:hypothetical protein
LATTIRKTLEFREPQRTAASGSCSCSSIKLNPVKSIC